MNRYSLSFSLPPPPSFMFIDARVLCMQTPVGECRCPPSPSPTDSPKTANCKLSEVHVRINRTCGVKETLHSASPKRNEGTSIHPLWMVNFLHEWGYISVCVQIWRENAWVSSVEQYLVWCAAGLYCIILCVFFLNVNASMKIMLDIFYSSVVP